MFSKTLIINMGLLINEGRRCVYKITNIYEIYNLIQKLIFFKKRRYYEVLFRVFIVIFVAHR